MNNFMYRMIRAAKLDINLYEEVEVDKSALFGDDPFHIGSSAVCARCYFFLDPHGFIPYHHSVHKR